MKRILPTAALFTLTVLAPASATAMPPPVRVPILVVSENPQSEALGEAFVTMLHKRGWFERVQTVQRSDLSACVPKMEEACLRTTAAWKTGGAAVIVLAQGEAEQDWNCIGIAPTVKRPETQRVRLNLREGMFGSKERQAEERNKAGACIMAAGSESGW